MFEIRCENKVEEGLIRRIARIFGANLEICDQDPENTWFVMNELPSSADEDAIEEAIAEVTSAYERI